MEQTAQRTPIDPRFQQMLSILHAGGNYAYWWNKDPHSDEKKTEWWVVGQPTNPTNGIVDAYFGVHPTVKIPDTRINRKGETYTPRPEKVRAEIEEIAAVNALFAEYDAKHYASKADALAAVQALEPAPSVIIDSGGGYHLYWLLNATWKLNTDEDRACAADVQSRWVAFVGGDTGAKDLARVLRVPGTHNLKYENKPTVSFVKADFEQQYSIDYLISLLPAQETEKPAQTATGPSVLNDDKRKQAYVERAFKEEVAAVAMATEGFKHSTLYKSAAAIGNLIPHGLSEQAATDALYNAISGRAKDKKGALDTIMDGLRDGKATPRVLPSFETEQPMFDVNGMPHCPRCNQEMFHAKRKDVWGCDACNKTDKPFWWNGNGYEPRTVAAVVIDTATGEIQETIDTKSFWSKGITAKALRTMRFDPLHWVVDDILPEGCTLLAGKPKARKSWLALNIGLAVALGGRAMSFKNANKGDVLYLDLESNERRAQRRLEATLRDMEWPDNFHLFTEWPKLDDGGDVLLEQWMHDHPDTKLVVVDVFQDIRAVANPKAQLYSDDRAAVEPLRRFASKYHVAVLIIHHTRKAKGDDVFDEISGSTGLTGGVDNIMVLSRDAEDGDKASLAIRGRDIEFDNALSLEWDFDFCQWRYKGEDSAAGVPEERKALLKLMEPDVIYTPADLAELCGKTPKNVSKMLRLLESGRHVASAGFGKYKLVDDSNDDVNESRSSGSSGSSRNGRSSGSGMDSPLLPLPPQGYREVEVYTAVESQETPTSTTSTTSTLVAEMNELNWVAVQRWHAAGSVNNIRLHCAKVGVSFDAVMSELKGEELDEGDE